MPEGVRKNLWIKSAVAEDFDAFVKTLEDAGTDIRHGQVMSAALIAFFELDEGDQLKLIERARNYDLEKYQASRAAKHHARARKAGR